MVFGLLENSLHQHMLHWEDTDISALHRQVPQLHCRIHAGSTASLHRNMQLLGELWTMHDLDN